MAARVVVVLWSAPLWLCLLAPWVSAPLCWPLAVLAIGFPWVYLGTLPAALWCAWKRRWRLLAVPALALLWGLGYLPSFLGWHGQARGALRVLSMNGHYFDALDTNTQQVKKNIDECKPILRSLQPNVVCAQDFSTSSQEDNNRIEYYLRFDLGLPNFIYCMPSLASYSRTPISAYHGMVFPDTFNSYCAIDVSLAGRMVRVYNLHLESYQFGREKTLRKTAQVAYQKLRNGLKKRSDQAEFVAQSIASSPYPVVVCGDLNDVPTSYVYRTVLGPLQDGFRQRGQGLAFTYQGKIPGLRIDYMFCSKELRFTGYQNFHGPRFLDHRWVVGDLVWR
ncbi:endonuclease/exonuclease/phosphatase family protein [bacterium]|nr:endonuclease/exonuclease/phosphatase family protein [bacterium]